MLPEKVVFFLQYLLALEVVSAYESAVVTVSVSVVVPVIVTAVAVVGIEVVGTV